MFSFQHPIPVTLVISCEHAGNRIPIRFASLLSAKEPLLQTHRGYDMGAYHLSLYLKKCLKAAFFYHTATRLLIDVNRSAGNPQLFSEFTGNLPETVKGKLISNLYLPYRQRVENYISDHLKHGMPVYHISVHSFTPLWNGKIREVDIGLLFDDRDRHDRLLFSGLMEQWVKRLPQWRVLENQPYHGNDDGLVPSLREKYFKSPYVGFEVELNQHLFTLKNPRSWFESIATGLYHWLISQ